MKRKLVQAGGSLAVTLPAEVVQEFKLRKGMRASASYVDDAAKAAALLHSLLMNHPFVDGNKRVGAHAALLHVRANAWELLFTPRDLTELALAVARGALEAEAIAIWLRQRTRRVEP